MGLMKLFPRNTPKAKAMTPAMRTAGAGCEIPFVERTYVTYAPREKKAPWDRLTTFTTPRISAIPAAMRA